MSQAVVTMLSMFGVLFKGAVGTFWGRAVAIGLAALAALGLNNMYQRSVGEKRAVVKIIKKTNVEAKKKNAKVRKIRRSIERGGAHKRLLEDFTRSDSD